MLTWLCLASIAAKSIPPPGEDSKAAARGGQKGHFVSTTMCAAPVRWRRVVNFILPFATHCATRRNTVTRKKELLAVATMATSKYHANHMLGVGWFFRVRLNP